jgi:hypothetical protein
MAIAARKRHVDAGEAWSWFGLSLRDWGLAGGLVVLGGALVCIAGPLTKGQ